MSHKIWQNPFILFLLFANIIIWSAIFTETPGRFLKVYFLNIGQGDAIFIEAPNGRQMLIDGGRDARVLNELGQVMGFFDRSIDVVLATHPDADHIGGMPFVIEHYNVKNFIDSVADSDTKVYDELEKIVREKNIETFYAMREMVVVLDRKNGVYFHILYPIQDDFRYTDTNDLSAVGKLVYGDTSFMLTGDAPKTIEGMLYSTDGDYLNSSVLKAGHHGSRTSSSPSFVKAVQPTYAVISAGKNNSYGHPHKEVIEFFAKENIPVLSTIDLGRIEFESSGIDIWLR